jgi:hypothetical protein
MAGNEGTLSMSLKVRDDGSIVLDRFSGKLDDLNKTAKQQDTQMKDLTQTWGTMMAKVAGISAIIYGAVRGFESLANSIKTTAASAMEIEKMAGIVGTSTDQLQKMQYAAKMADVEQESLTTGLRFLSRNMDEANRNTGTAAVLFRAMGISVNDASGHLKPLDDMMREIANKFASWTSGPQKIAIAMGLFGRGAEALIPLLDKGGAGIKSLADEAEKGGRILSPDLVKKGAELEEQFKKTESTISAVKTALILTYTPAASLGDAIGGLGKKLIDFYTDPAVKGVINFLTGFVPGGQILNLLQMKAQQADLAKAMSKMPDYWAGQAQPAKKVAPPSTDEWVLLYGMTQAQLKDRMSVSKLMFEDWKQRRGIGLDFVDIFGMTEDELRDRMSISKLMYEDWKEKRGIAPLDFVDLYGITEDEFKDRMSISKLSYEAWKEHRGITPLDFVDLYGMTEDELKDRMGISKLLGEGWMEKYTATPNTISQILKMESTWQEFGNTVNNIWAQNVTGMVKGTTTIHDAFKNMCTGMLDTFISAIAKMATNWLLFQNVQGTYKSGAGLIGLIGGLFGAKEGGIVNASYSPIRSFQGGGYADRPTLGVFGEGGPEAFVPLRNGKIPIEGGRGQTVIKYSPIFITAMDTQSVRDFARRNKGQFIELMTSNANDAGPMRQR